MIAGLAVPPIGETVAPPASADPRLLGHVAVPTPDGGMEFREAPANDLAPRNVPHGANLAEVLDRHVLDRLADRLIEGVEADRASNAEMTEIFEQGLKLLMQKPGLRLDKPFPGSAGVVHPILMESVIRGSASARGEMLPAAGPARCQVMGDSTPDKEALAERKQGWLNYYLTDQDEDYYPDFDQMLMLLWARGSMFRKVYRDPLRRGAPVSRFLTPTDLVVNYAASSLKGAARITQIEDGVQPSDIKRLQLKGWYADVPLSRPDDVDSGEGRRIALESEGRTVSIYDDDATHQLWHVHTLLDIEGLEHVGPEGDPTGLPLPYVVTIEPTSQRVLRVARNWREGDDDFQPMEWFVHYILWPGMGFYGLGMIHLLGPVADALTMMQRQAINTTTLASFPGGFRAKGARPESSDVPIAPCEYREIDTGGQPIQSAIMPLPYKDLPPSFATVMDSLLQAGQRLASLSDVAVGDGREDALPGTVIALIEKATKLETTIVKRLHVVHRKELRMLADLFGQDAAAKYPYVVNGRSGTAVAADFQDNADVVPVSDPNIPTQTQRLVHAQGIWQVAQQSPLIDKKAALEGFLRAMGSTDAELATLIPPQQQGQPSDVVTEFAACLKGLPLAAGPQQNHAAHITAHMAQLTTPGLDKTPNHAALLAHIGDHIGLFYAGEASRLSGMPLQPGQVPPQMEPQVAMAVAAASQALRQSLMQLAPPGDASDPNAAAEAATKMADIQQRAAESQRKAASEAQQRAQDWAEGQAQRQDDAAERATRLREAELSLAQVRQQNSGDIAEAQIDYRREDLKAQAALAVEREKTEQARLDAEASARNREPQGV